MIWYIQISEGLLWRQQLFFLGKEWSETYLCGHKISVVVSDLKVQTKSFQQWSEHTVSRYGEQKH